MNLVLANSDYARHTTDEGHQLQAGLAHAGWTLAGFGYGDGCRDIPTLLDRHRPERIFVQDCRDLLAGSPGCFDDRTSPTGIEALADYPARRITVLKDAGTAVDYQRAFAKRIGAGALVIYYHPDTVLALSPWASDYQLVRTYHTIDADLARSIEWPGRRRRGLVSGAVSGVYPLRRLAFACARDLNIDTLRHPGYGNRGCHTGRYLLALADYKVHVATASRYAFALRKIIESVAMGCTPVTDLPAWDRLPEIDDALVRVRPGAGSAELKRAIDTAERDWDATRALHFAEKAWAFYDYRTMGRRLSEALA